MISSYNFVWLYSGPFVLAINARLLSIRDAKRFLLVRYQLLDSSKNIADVKVEMHTGFYRITVVRRY